VGFQSQRAVWAREMGQQSSDVEEKNDDEGQRNHVVAIFS
jgi:hypothetical protein